VSVIYCVMNDSSIGRTSFLFSNFSEFAFVNLLVCLIESLRC